MRTTVLDPEPTATTSDLRTVVEGVAGVDTAGWSGAARSADLVELLQASERLQSVALARLASWDASGAWAEDGAPSAIAWLAHRGSLTKHHAAGLVRSARLVHAHERTAKTLDAGDITVEHVAVLARAARDREEVFGAHEDTLLDAARTLAPEPFRHAARHWRTLADDRLATADARECHEQRRLHCSSTFRGTVRIDGELDPDAGATFLAALEAHLDGPDATDGPTPARSLAQRRADALLALCQGGRRRQVHVDVVVDVDTLTGDAIRDITAVRNSLHGLGPVARSTLERLTCDASIGRVIMRGRSEILDVGRRTRLVTPTQRRALVIRDGGCVAEGCDRPADWCDAHHVVHWIDGAMTDVSILTLLCSLHHHHVHDGTWELVPNGAGAWTARPTPHQRE
ncbi:MAG TPA: DUF222 domain-containing protein [Acidimicrobiia bacterium]|nr:DUF222 domain-containing protein [Acidimicrobiia bacterium]